MNQTRRKKASRSKNTGNGGNRQGKARRRNTQKSREDYTQSEQ
jgi:hypothetical protein